MMDSDMQWTKRRPGDIQLSCFALNDHIDVDSRDRWLAFSVYRSLSSTDEGSIVQLPFISWYAIVDVSSGALVVTGPHSQEPTQQVVDHIIGWSPSHLVVKRSRLIHAGEDRSASAEQSPESADEVSIVLVSLRGEERVLHSFVCRSDHRLPLPPPCSKWMLGNFTLCRNGDCVVFTRFVPVFREQANPIFPQRRIVSPDGTKSRDAIHVVDLATGRERILGETPAGWRCRDIWYDCSSGKMRAVVSSRRGDNEVLGVAVKDSKTPSALKLLQTFERVHYGQLSPDGSAVALVNGDGDKDNSVLKIIRLTPRPNLLREIVIPGWRRRVIWSRDSRRLALWYNVWFHDRLGRKYQRMYEGYRIWVVDQTGANARSLAPEWAGLIALTWSRRNEGLFVVANGTLGYLDVRRGNLRRIWEFPQEWYEASS